MGSSMMMMMMSDLVLVGFYVVNDRWKEGPITNLDWV
jgi:hypothetical protein